MQQRYKLEMLLKKKELLMSESQERMLVVIDPKNLKEFLKICNKYNVEAVDIAKFDGSKKLNVFYGKEKVSDLEMSFIYGGLPQRVMNALAPTQGKLSEIDSDIPKTEKQWLDKLEEVLSSGDI